MQRTPLSHITILFLLLVVTCFWLWKAQSKELFFQKCEQNKRNQPVAKVFLKIDKSGLVAPVEEEIPITNLMEMSQGTYKIDVDLRGKRSVQFAGCTSNDTKKCLSHCQRNYSNNEVADYRKANSEFRQNGYFCKGAHAVRLYTTNMNRTASIDRGDITTMGISRVDQVKNNDYTSMTHDTVKNFMLHDENLNNECFTNSVPFSMRMQNQPISLHRGEALPVSKLDAFFQVYKDNTPIKTPSSDNPQIVLNVDDQVKEEYQLQICRPEEDQDISACGKTCRYKCINKSWEQAPNSGHITQSDYRNTSEQAPLKFRIVRRS
jgi:hypothetical protein